MAGCAPWLAIGLAGEKADLAVDTPEVVTDTLLDAELQSRYDSLWDRATLIDRPDGRLIQEVSITGRIQADATSFHAHQGSYDALTWRAVRLGGEVSFLRNFTLLAEGEYDPSLNSFSERLTDAYVAWSRSPRLELKAGKHTAPFTLDGATSSKRLITTDRSNLARNLWNPVEYHTGTSISGEVRNWSYFLGGFSASDDSFFGEFDGGYFGLVSLGYDFADACRSDRALVRVDYMNNQYDQDNDGTSNLGNVLSLVTQWEKDRWGLWTDITGARGQASQPDLFGTQIMPFYWVTEKTQVVARYTFLNSDGDNGLLLGRYGNRIEPGFGDQSHDFYLGLNHYFYGHKLKWQTGVQYTTATDAANDGGAYDGWGVTTGIRISW